MSFVQITLLGDLQQFSPSIPLAVRSIREVISALDSQFEGFRAYLTQMSLNGFDYKIIADKSEFGEEDIDKPISREVVIIPVLKGSGAIGRIIAGVVLVGLAFSGIGLPVASTALLGASLALGGLAELFNPPKDKKKDEKSFLISGASNTASPKEVVPVVLGNGFKGEGLIVGSVTVSAVIRTYEINNDDDD